MSLFLYMYAASLEEVIQRTRGRLFLPKVYITTYPLTDRHP